MIIDFNIVPIWVFDDFMHTQVSVRHQRGLARTITVTNV